MTHHQRLFKEYLVPARSVHDFLDRYYRKERINIMLKAYPDYKDVLYVDYESMIAKFGITWISQYDNVTGKTVAWMPTKNKRRKA